MKTQNSSSTTKHKHLIIILCHHLSRDFLMQIYFLRQPVDIYQLEVMNAKKRFLFITLLRINLFL